MDGCGSRRVTCEGDRRLPAEDPENLAVREHLTLADHFGDHGAACTHALVPVPVEGVLHDTDAGEDVSQSHGVGQIDVPELTQQILDALTKVGSVPHVEYCPEQCVGASRHGAR